MTSYEERLETVPAHPEQAKAYPELLALWKALRVREEPDPAELAEWDQLVMALLTTDERGYYLDEKRLTGATVAAGKVNRLSGILLGRHNPPVETIRRRASPSAPSEDVSGEISGSSEETGTLKLSGDEPKSPEQASEEAEGPQSASESPEDATPPAEASGKSEDPPLPGETSEVAADQHSGAASEDSTSSVGAFGKAKDAPAPDGTPDRQER